MHSFNLPPYSWATSSSTTILCPRHSSASCTARLFISLQGKWSSSACTCPSEGINTTREVFSVWKYKLIQIAFCCCCGGLEFSVNIHKAERRHPCIDQLIKSQKLFIPNRMSTLREISGTTSCENMQKLRSLKPTAESQARQKTVECRFQRVNV